MIDESFRLQHVSKHVQFPYLVAKEKPDKVIVIYGPHWFLEDKPSWIQNMWNYCWAAGIELIVLSSEQSLVNYPEHDLLKKIVGDVHSQKPWLAILNDVTSKTVFVINGWGDELQTQKDINACLELLPKKIFALSAARPKGKSDRVREMCWGYKGVPLAIIEYGIKRRRRK